MVILPRRGGQRRIPRALAAGNEERNWFYKGSVSVVSEVGGLEAAASFDTSTGGYTVTAALPAIRIGSAKLSVVGTKNSPKLCEADPEMAGAFLKGNLTLDDHPNFNAVVAIISYCKENPSKGWEITGSLVQWTIKGTVLDDVTISLSDKKRGSGASTVSKEWTFTARATVSVGNMDQGLMQVFSDDKDNYGSLALKFEASVEGKGPSVAAVFDNVVGHA